MHNIFKNLNIFIFYGKWILEAQRLKWETSQEALEVL